MSIYSITPADFAFDQRVKDKHRQVMLAFGVHSSRKHWIKLSQTKLAEQLEVARETVNRAVADLVQWGYIEKRTPTETGKSICFYRIVMSRAEPGDEDDDDSIEGDDEAQDVVTACDQSITPPCDPTRHTPVILPVTPPVTAAVTHIRSSSRSKENVQGARVRASDKSARASAAPQEAASVTIYRTTHPKEFAAWRAWHEKHSISTRVFNMDRFGATVEPSLMPPVDKAELAKKTADRIIGESA